MGERNGPIIMREVFICDEDEERTELCADVIVID